MEKVWMFGNYAISDHMIQQPHTSTSTSSWCNCIPTCLLWDDAI